MVGRLRLYEPDYPHFITNTVMPRIRVFCREHCFAVLLHWRKSSAAKLTYLHESSSRAYFVRNRLGWICPSAGYHHCGESCIVALSPQEW